MDIEKLRLHGYEADKALQQKNPEALDWPYIADAQLAKALWGLVEERVHYSDLRIALIRAGIPSPN